MKLIGFKNRNEVLKFFSLHSLVFFVYLLPNLIRDMLHLLRSSIQVSSVLAVINVFAVFLCVFCCSLINGHIDLKVC